QLADPVGQPLRPGAVPGQGAQVVGGRANRARRVAEARREDLLWNVRTTFTPRESGRACCRDCRGRLLKGTTTCNSFARSTYATPARTQGSTTGPACREKGPTVFSTRSALATSDRHASGLLRSASAARTGAGLRLSASW